MIPFILILRYPHWGDYERIIIDIIPVISKSSVNLHFISPWLHEFMYFVYFSFQMKLSSHHRINKQDPACKKMSCTRVVRQSPADCSPCLLPIGDQLLADQTHRTWKAASTSCLRHPCCVFLECAHFICFHILTSLVILGYSFTEMSIQHIPAILSRPPLDIQDVNRKINGSDKYKYTEQM